MPHGVAESALGDREVGAAQDRRRQQVPTHGIGPVDVEHLVRVWVVAQRLRHLAAVFTEHDAVAQAAGECRTIEQRRGEHVHRVEPPPSLADVLDDEVAGIVMIEPLGVLERVVNLCERHRTGLEPAVEDFGHTTHRRSTGGVVRIGPREVVDRRAMQIGDLDAEVALEVVDRAVRIDSRVRRIVALPDRDRRPPEPVATDGPVSGVLEPLSEAAVLDVLGNPGDLLVQFDHPVTELGDLHEPRRDRSVDQRLCAPPTVRIRVVVAVVAHDDALVLERTDDRRIGVEHVLTDVVGHLCGVLPVLVHRADRGNTDRIAGDLVVLAETRGHVHDPGTVLGRHEIRAQHLECVRGVGEVVEHRAVAAPDDFGTGHRADPL